MVVGVADADIVHKRHVGRAEAAVSRDQPHVGRALALLDGGGAWEGRAVDGAGRAGREEGWPTSVGVGGAGGTDSFEIGTAKRPPLGHRAATAGNSA